MIKIFWAGVNTDTRRVWGYFVDEKIHSSSFGNIKLVQTFWGRVGGNLYFQVSANTREFQKSAIKKSKKYKFTKEFNNHLITEYEKHILVKKLKGEYE
jgi:hypothetical protein